MPHAANVQSQLTLPIIGYHHSPLSQKFGIPRQPNLVQLASTIEMVAPYHTPEAFRGIEDFSHLWITWHTHHNHLKQGSDDKENQGRGAFKPTVRPPRLGGNTKLGVFATRSTYRPSQLGLSVVKLIKVEQVSGGVRLHISGADMVDGTPIIDIKPYIGYSDAVNDAVSGFAPDKPALKSVIMTSAAQHDFEQYCQQESRDLTAEDKEIIQQLIAQDPRPAYRQRDKDRVFFMRYKHYDIGFCQVDDRVLKSADRPHDFNENSLQIVSIQPA